MKLHVTMPILNAKWVDCFQTEFLGNFILKSLLTLSINLMLFPLLRNIQALGVHEQFLLWSMNRTRKAL